MTMRTSAAVGAGAAVVTAATATPARAHSSSTLRNGRGWTTMTIASAVVLALIAMFITVPTTHAAPSAATAATPSVISTPIPVSKTVTLTPHAPVQPRTLVLLDDLATKWTHSHLFDMLEQSAHQVTFALASDDSIRLERYGTYQYDNIIVMAPRALVFGAQLTPKHFVAFVDAGYNVFFVFDQSVSEPMRLLAFELGAEIAEDSVIVDHFQYDAVHDASFGGQHALIAHGDALANSSIITGAISSARPILFHGIAHTMPLLSVQFSELFHPILRASPTAFSKFSALSAAAAAASGSNLFEPLLLVSAYQTRSNARITFAGSTVMFSNALVDAPVQVGGNKAAVSGNRAFTESLVSWAVGDRGVLRARTLQHKQVNGEDVNPHSYRVSDEVVFSIVLEEFDGRSRRWVPFVASDVQLEFIMFDPAIRQFLPVSDASMGSYSLALTVPDVYGVYKFVIDYQRRGYTHLLVSQQVSITPYRHNQYERFLLPAYPYYVSTFSLMAAFYLFGIVFLYQVDEAQPVSNSRK